MARSRKTRIAAFGLALTVLLGSGVVLRERLFQNWMRAQIINTYLKRVQPNLPFKIESVSIDDRWEDLKEGKLTGLSAVLLAGKWRIRLGGPIDLSLVQSDDGDRDFEARFTPTVTIEPAQAWPLGKIERSDPAVLHLFVKANRIFTHLHALGLKTEARSWQWKLLHIDLQDAKANLEWDAENASVNVQAKRASFNLEARKHLSLSGISLRSHAPMLLHPFSLGPRIDVDWVAKASQVIWEQKKLELPLELFPFHAEVATVASPLKFLSAKFRVGNVKPMHFTVHPEFADGRLRRAEIDWRTSEIPVNEALDRALNALSNSLSLSQLTSLSQINVKSGTFQAGGKLKLDLEKPRPGFDADFHLRDVSMEWPESHLALAGFSLELPVHLDSVMDARIEAKRIYYKHLAATLAPLSFQVDPRGKAHIVELGSHGAFPLRVDGIPLQIGQVTGKVESRESFDLSASLNLDRTQLQAIAEKLCIPTAKLPPAEVSLSFPKIHATAASFEPEGEVRASVFGGDARITNLAVYDPLSEVPETDFDFTLDHLELSQLGDWSGFGEMDGVLNAYAHDATMQAMLPTRFDFRMEVKPLHKSEVVFSPEAMRNFARIFAADQINHLPGILDWIAFGLPRRILGGYNINYAGISAFSTDGFILLEGVDPPEVRKATGMSFILYGPRFKMPLQAKKYPLIIGAPAMANYIHQLTGQLGKIGKVGKPQPKSPPQSPKEAPHEESPVACIPPRL